MKKILWIAFIIFNTFILADERPPYIRQLEAQISTEKDRTKVSTLLKERDDYMKNYLNSISQSESSVFYLGDQYFKERKYEKAAQIFSSNTDSVRNLFGAATSYRLIGKYEKAIDFYSVALNLNPNLKEAYLGRGLAYRNIDKTGKASEDIQIYLRISPNPEGFLALADIYLSEKKIDKAKATLQEGRKLFPQSKEITQMLSSIYSK